jgi:hypothetical protein
VFLLDEDLATSATRTTSGLVMGRLFRYADAQSGLVFGVALVVDEKTLSCQF